MHPWLSAPILAAACARAGAPATPPPLLPSAPAASSTTAETVTPGDPVWVSQRLPFATNETPLDEEGKLFLVHGADGLHVVGVEDGRTHGVLPGVLSHALFAPGGHQVVGVVLHHTLRLWDLRTDRARDLPLARDPVELVALHGAPAVAVLGIGGYDVIDVAAGTAMPVETAKGRRVNIVSRAPSGALAASSGGSVYLADAKGKAVRTVARPASALALHPQGTAVAIGHGGTVLVVDVAAAEGAAGRESEPCPDAAIEQLEWSGDGAHLFAACRSKGSRPSLVVSISPEGALERELVRADERTLALAVRGDRVAVRGPSLGVIVFDAAAGRELYRLSPPDPSLQPRAVSGNLERSLFGKHDAVATLTLVERDRPARPLRLEPSAASMRIRAAGSTLALSYDRETVVLDPRTGETSPARGGVVGPDGKTTLLVANDTLELVDRSGGHHALSSLSKGVYESPRFSPGGGWVLFAEAFQSGFEGPTEHKLFLFDAATGKVGKTLLIGPGRFPWAVAPDDSTLALTVNVGRGLDPKETCATEDYACAAIRVFEPRSGRRLAEIRPRDREVRPAEYVDAHRVLVSGRVYDAAKGRLAWSVPDDASVTHVFPSLGKVLLRRGGASLLVEAASGKTVREMPVLERVAGGSPNGGFFVGVAQGQASIWSTSTWTGVPIDLTVERDASVLMSDDGRFAYLVSGADFLVYRVADRHWLRRALPRLDFDVTDEGLFDFRPGGEAAAAVRRGPDVERSPIGPLTLLGDRRRPGVYGEFIAGR
jgi:hypothetical protein